MYEFIHKLNNLILYLLFIVPAGLLFIKLNSINAAKAASHQQKSIQAAEYFMVPMTAGAALMFLLLILTIIKNFFPKDGADDKKHSSNEKCGDIDSIGKNQ